jgi:uncharacterized OB-fold protein
MPKMVEPDVGYDDESFWNGVKRGKLLLARCARCSRLQHPPSPMCPHCGSVAWEAQEASGRGTVQSWIVSHHPTKPDDAPRIVALIDLEEGARLVSNLQDVEVADVTNDMAVEVVFCEVDGFTLPQFRPAQRGSV